MTQRHSHPVLRRPIQEKKTRSVPTPEPVDEYPAEVPSFVKEDHTYARERRVTAEITYADPSVFEDIASRAADIEDRFDHKRVLFIGSEAYDAATITILQGLQALGFTVNTLHKPNINSWFCNEVITSTSGLKFDFVISNVGWGIRWSHYGKYKLSRFPRVLINGTGSNLGWMDRIDWVHHWVHQLYHDNSRSDESDKHIIQPYCWAEMPSNYVPDETFHVGQGGGVYLPVGIHNEAMELAQGKSTVQRRPIGDIGESIHRGEALIDPRIAGIVSKDGPHGWRYWVRYRGTFNIYNIVSLFTHSGDITRVVLWDKLACGCLPLIPKPKYDISSYPVTGLSPFCVYQSDEEVTDKYDWLVEHPAYLAKLRHDCEELAYKYFTPAPLARRFLLYVKGAIG